MYKQRNKAVVKGQHPFEKYLTEEDKLHIAVLTYLAHQYPKASVFHAVNEGKRTPFEQWKAKKLGLSAGWPDLVILHHGRQLAIELKTITGRATPAQKEWLEKLNANGWDAHLCKGFEAAVGVIDAFFAH